MRNFYKFMLSAFGVGWLPLAPGTWGAAVAIIPLMPFAIGWAPSPPPSVTSLILTIFIVIFTWIGVKGSDLLENEWGKDPKQTVIDEMVGVWIAILGMPISWFSLIAAFVLFRFFDIAKPLGIRQLEKIGDGWGVMLDDILAGVYANIVLQVLIIFL
jgi:phosphatidylglycerophosphatase A